MRSLASLAVNLAVNVVHHLGLSELGPSLRHHAIGIASHSPRGGPGCRRL
jgi:hypothetical protein